MVGSYLECAKLCILSLALKLKKEISKYFHQNTFKAGNLLFLKKLLWRELRPCALSGEGDSL